MIKVTTGTAYQLVRNFNTFDDSELLSKACGYLSANVQPREQNIPCISEPD